VKKAACSDLSKAFLYRPAEAAAGAGLSLKERLGAPRLNPKSEALRKV